MARVPCSSPMLIFALLFILALCASTGQGWLYPGAQSPHQRGGIDSGYASGFLPATNHQQQQRRVMGWMAAAVANPPPPPVSSEEDDDEWEQWEKRNIGGNSLSKEEEEGLPDPREDLGEQPDIICEGKGHSICTCVNGTPSVVDCNKAQLKSGQPLDTAFLVLSERIPKEFRPQVVKLTHNDIELLRVGQVMPGEERHIISIDFSYNRIADVEAKTFDSFTGLRKLRLSHNHLRDQEMSVDWLTPALGRTLHQLYLDWNYLRVLDDGLFENLGGLTKLVLDGNRGLQLHASTFGPANKLAKLKTLSLDACGINSLDQDLFVGLPALQELSLSGNPITSVPLALTSAPLGLSVLALSETNFKTIPAYAFKAMPKLTKVYFRNMPLLTGVDDCAFCRAKNLQLVDFSKSARLATIHPNAFGGSSDSEPKLGELQTILLEHCALTGLDPALIDWEQVVRITLAGNPFDCTDCASINWYTSNRKWVQKRSKGSEPTCAATAIEQQQAETKPTELESVREQLQCSAVVLPPRPRDTSGSEKTTLGLVLLGLCGAMLGTAYYVVRKRREWAANGGGGGLLTAPSFFRREAANPQLGYANLPNQQQRGHHGGGRYDEDEVADEIDARDAGDMRRLERDFNRPEFV